MTIDDTKNGISSIDRQQPQSRMEENAYQEILDEIEKQKSKRKSWLKNLIILAVTLLIFYQLGFFEFGPGGIIMIIIVLLVHETGHFVAMRLFGYKNVQMFFIPMFGAAVSGESRNTPAYKEAIVSLLGPVPGVIIGCVLLFFYAATGQDFYFNFATMFLFINIFNLLPFYPLDGGRFFHTVLFSRNRYLELCFRICAALALILVGFAIGAWLLAILGLASLITARIPFKLAKAAQQVRKSDVYRNSSADVDNRNIVPDTIPLAMGKVIIDEVYENFPPPVDTKTVARYTKDIWDRIPSRPAGVASTIALLIVYFLVFCLPIASFVGSSIVSAITRKGFVKSVVVEYQKLDGSTGLKEQFYIFGGIESEVEIDPESYLYHGTETYFKYDDPNTISGRGTWSQGKLDGEFKLYNEQGELIRVTVYDNGNFVSRRVKVDGQWVDRQWQDLPITHRSKIKECQRQPQGPATK